MFLNWNIQEKNNSQKKKNKQTNVVSRCFLVRKSEQEHLFAFRFVVELHVLLCYRSEE